jgi:hypothetical protein
VEEVMKKQIVKISSMALMTAAVLAAGATTARADERIVANVPFPFIVGNTTLPAGSYTVTEKSMEGVLAISSADGRDVVTILTIPSSSDTEPSDAQLVFKKFENHYFLTGVNPPDSEGREIVLTPAMMVRDIARSADTRSN